ncbi:MAG: PQQ-like beta-propeller repeat protein [Thermoplasmata archaeon]|nr:PQQ-like beta-propeller repeat protein [Thermoplasmata archaeon]MBE3136717.1 PQQ-like beta-propeller repeat protein [Thermoplasmata archaeon]MBE3140480.1 PQQ-like beta-propeller repeat protein [Thermoplasmata archaeon]
MKRKSISKDLSIVFVGLLCIPLFIPTTFNTTVLSSENNPMAHTINSHNNSLSELHRFPEGYLGKSFISEPCETAAVQNPIKEKPINPLPLNGGPMDSPWPMYSHDVRHTGLSPYSTVENPLTEKWRFLLSWDSFYSGPILDCSGTIICGADVLYGIYPNGTEKWRYNPGRTIESTPIDENGVIYFGTIWGQPNYLHAIYSNNGTQKWVYAVGNSITSSPAIGSDGTIYFADWSGYVRAVSPNGTQKWAYHTGDVITSSPAIGNDGTIYIGSHDDYVYAFYPNGTVKWQYQTGNWVHASPTIGSDGTIYIGSDDGYLYALNPENGSMIWRCNIGYTWCSPTLGPDGTIYLGVWEMKFYAIYPNGTIKWTYNAPGRIWFGSSATVSSDGTIFFGTTKQDGGSGALIALNPDGTERFKNTYGYFATSPAIGDDGTVYAASFNYAGMIGHLHAFGSLDPNAPIAPTITGQTNGKIKKTYTYTFTSTSPLENNIYYLVDWGDGTTTDWLGPYNSSETIALNHSWEKKGTYVIKARAKDTDNLWGPWGTLSVNMPCSYDKPVMNFLERVLERYPHAFPILRYILSQCKTFF